MYVCMYVCMYVFILHVAKWNLGKVKIKPMLVAGLCLLGSVDNPQSACDRMQGGRKGLVPPLH